MTEHSSEIAVLGYGCRLPGAGDADALWTLLREGGCAVRRVGPDRWSARGLEHPDRGAPGTTYSAVAGLLDDPFAFDAAFFGVSPREAAQTDPQQRLLLHVAWEALELAGLTPERVAGPRTGVYVGASGLDYGNSLAGDPAAADAKFMLGNTLSILANRVAHFLDAQGPSYVVDTACSSALFAFHAACAALKAGEIDLAIVGGVNLLLTPMPFVGFSRAAMLSPTGLCKPFDHRADGYVRAEGAVAFAIARRDWAEAAGDRPRGFVVGTAINSDGRANALSVPNSLRQADLMRAVYAEAGVAPDRIAFVEAHGTGTAVGDPLEARAIGDAIAQGRAAPLPIGSIKSNIGHLEPAAGLAGLLKAQLALEKGLLPATLHIERPNPEIPFEALNLAPAVESVALEVGAEPLVAGVNAFGFGGANAHVAIRQPDAVPAADPLPAHAAPLILSAATAEALTALAARWRDRLSGADEAETAGLVDAAARRRARLARRLVVTETDSTARLAALDAFAEGREGGWVSDAALSGGPKPVAFVFSGNGSQWPGMGRAAFAADPAFREGFEATAAAVAAEGGIDLVEALHAADLEARLAEAETAQPLLLGLQIGLVEALAARGVRPAMVAGHSVGEVAAAWASGALDLAAVARLAVRRARCQAPLFGTGAMAAVLASAEAVEALVAEAGIADIGIAADNSPRGATVSGSVEAIDALAAVARARRVAVRKLKVDYPFHGPLMERIRDDLAEALEGMAPRPPRVPFCSTAFPEDSDAPLDAAYWWANARNPVHFRQAALRMAARGAGVFVEIGPQPTLQHYVTDTLSAEGIAGKCLPGFRRQGRDAEDAAAIAGRVLAAGGAVDEAAVFGPRRPMTVAAPAYPWTLKDHAFARTADALNLMRHPARRGLLGWRAAAGEGPWRLALDAAAEPWLADHAVDGAPVLPAAGFVELALAAAAEALGDGSLELVDFDVLRPLALEARADVRTHHDPTTGAVRIESRPFLADDPFAPHAQGTIRLAAGPAPAPGPRIEAAAEPDADLYDALGRLGLGYGPAFRRAGRPEPAPEGGVRAELAPSHVADLGPWTLDPTALDAAFHLLAALLATDPAGPPEPGLCFLPVRIGRLTVHAPGRPAAAASARLVRRGLRSVEAAFALTDAEGAPVATVEGARFAAVRLARRAEPEAAFWRESFRALRLDPARPAVLPAVWAEPAARLAALDIVATAPTEPGAAALILDAACRRVAWEAARAVAPRGGVGFRARRTLPPGLGRALSLGLAALAEDGAFDPDADRVADAAPVPSLGALVDALIATAPEEAARLAAVLRLAALFEERRDGERAPPSAEPPWTALGRAARDLCAAVAPGAPFDVALVGAPPAALADALREAGAARVEILPFDGEDAWRAARARGPFDAAVVGCETPADAQRLRRVAAALAPEGLLIAAAPEDDLLTAMLRAACGAPAPVAAADWPREATAAGFRDAALLAAAHAPARFVVARAGPQTAASAPEETVAPVAILSDAGGPGLAAAVALQEALTQGGRRARIVADAADVEPGEAVALLAGCAARDGSDPDALAARFAPLRALVARGDPGTLFVASFRTGPGAAAAPRPIDAALARVARVLANERPDCDVRAVSAAGEDAADAARRLAKAILAPGAERSLALDAKGAAAPRVAAAADVPARAARARAAGETALALEAGVAGGLDSLRWTPRPRRAPGPGEVEIAVAATGLNFRDVMWAMGLLPEEAIEEGFAGVQLGMECAGVVVRAGPGARLTVGERVAAFAAGAFATHVTVPDSAVAAIPDGMGFAEAATLPVAVATAWRGLVDLGRLSDGETVLIHGGAGGVGLAALQIARHRGARVLATAGAPEKRTLLKLLGADAVFDSRSLGFADAVMAATKGRGVDVALNSLSGEAMERTLGCMAAFGRFVELGKRDYYANARLGLRPMRRNLAYFGVDLDAMLAARPESARPLLDRLAESLASGEIAPLPHRLFQGEDAVEAFRLMQRAGHVGKIVVVPPEADAAAEPAAQLARPDGAWLITGGARGFGLAFAERLAAQGAGAVWLTNRSGVVAPADEPVLARMRAAGCRVEVVACDAADEGATRALLQRIAAEGPPLRGVAHGALVLDDALFADATPERVAAAARPKIAGAAVLDRLTRVLPIEHFLLFSSISAAFGNPGQTAYVAANAGIEAVARARRAEGLPALAVQWGPITDAGVLADDDAARARLERRGAGLMTASDALDRLETALAGRRPDDAVLAIAPMRWAALAPDLPLLASPLFERVDLSRGTAAAGGAADLRALVAGRDDAAALKVLIDLFRAEAATILRQAPEDVDPNRPMADLGFDSLMGVELKLSTEEKYGVALPVFSLSDGATLAALAARVLADLRRTETDGEAHAKPEAEDDAMEAMVARHMGAGAGAAARARLEGEGGA